MCDTLLVFVRFNNKFLSFLQSHKKVRKKSRECHNHKPQPSLDTKRKRKPTNPNNHKSNKRTISTKISSFFPKRGNRNAKRAEKQRIKCLLACVLVTFFLNFVIYAMCFSAFMRPKVIYFTINLFTILHACPYENTCRMTLTFVYGARLQLFKVMKANKITAPC